MSERRAFVTGATGLLGGNICEELLSQGWSVTALVRSTEKARNVLPADRIRLVQGTVEELEGYAAELESADVLFHAAAFFREYYQPGDHWERMKGINVDAALALMREADQRGVERTVFISSGGVIGSNGDGPPDESAPYSRFAEENLYFKTKVLAEKEIYRFLETSRMDVVMMLPGWMMGPGDAAPTSAGQLVLDLLHRKLPGLIDGGSALADARDVAAATVSAADMGKRGERYIVSGPLVTMREIAETIEQLTGVPAPGMQMPAWLALTVARLSETRSKLTGAPSRMPVNGVKTLLEKGTLNAERAQRELGARFRPVAETIADTIAWYRKHGYTTVDTSGPARTNDVAKSADAKAQDADAAAPGARALDADAAAPDAKADRR
jgi:dihydroflavonol-4-reductase